MYLTPKNILPRDGEVFYFGKVINKQDCDRLFLSLLETVPWRKDEVILFGKKIVVAGRQTAWYADDGITYTYSSVTKVPTKWSEDLINLKQVAENYSQAKFNSCLLNLYPCGKSGIGWHSDDEESLGTSITIASLSLGAERKFSFKHKYSKEIVSIVLEEGSLLSMHHPTQHYWKHSLPKTKKITNQRINLTFRMIVK